jgi:hypothetical protein
MIGVVENVRPHQDTATAALLSMLLGNDGRLVGRLRGVAVSAGISWPDGFTTAA